MTTPEITKSLFSLQDAQYRAFQIKLIPNIGPDSIIGVRTPALRSLAAELLKAGGYEEFLGDLPHRYFEENQLHAFIVSGMKDYPTCIKQVNRFLPFVDNWATCDQMSPKVFRKHRQELFSEIMRWIRSDRTYTIRFGVGMLMEHFLDEDFDPDCLRIVASIRSEEYYVKMMIAWYFATALAKQYDSALPIIENRSLDPWTHNKAIQKAAESYRIPADRKAYLKSLKIRKEG
ncbi:MAG: DNA alkylation repair protein [Clostridia bacterium]|nr:DNA alkylation repair protein [Clostridia bacterium]